MEERKLKPGDRFKVEFRTSDSSIRPDWFTYKGFWLTVVNANRNYYNARYNPEDNHGIGIEFPRHEYQQLEDLNWKWGQDFTETRIKGAYPEVVVAPYKNSLPDI